MICKDVCFNGSYIRHGTRSLFTKLDVEYSDAHQKKLTVESKIQDLSTPQDKKYAVEIFARHPATKLNLSATGEVYGGFGTYKMNSDAQYKRSFLTLQHGIITANINTNNKEVDFLVSINIYKN